MSMDSSGSWGTVTRVNPPAKGCSGAAGKNILSFCFYAEKIGTEAGEALETLFRVLLA